MNILTTLEVLEQYGEIQLQFDLFCNDYFIFKGETKDNKIILLMIDIKSVLELNPNNRLTLSQFEGILRDKDHKSHQYIKVKITDGFTNIYKSMGS